MDPDGHLSEQEEQELWRHYALDDGTTAGYDGRDLSGRAGDDAMTRSEEELAVGTETRERGRARLRKYVTTEQQTVTVPVQPEEEVVVGKRAVPKERVRLDTETVTDERQVSEEVHKEQIQVEGDQSTRRDRDADRR
jgi:stress response protein YsnF